MMHFKSVFLLIATLTTKGLATYKLTKDYSGYHFVSGFDYYNGQDPTHGHVQYKGYATANATGLTGFLVGPNGTNVYNSSLPPPIYLGVDHTNVYPNNVGRPSVRVSSVQSYNHSLIIADILHMPSSTCGLWPAFWMLGTSAPWPDAGEIDIIENVNDNNFNIMTLHTNAGVTLSNDTSLFNGTVKTTNCDVNAKDQDKNAGCSIKDKPEASSYGTKFNENGGGVFAVQYTSSHIAIWFFPRNAIPADISANAPVPPHVKNISTSAWGKPNALFQPPSSKNATSTTQSGNTVIPLGKATSTASATTTVAANSSTLDKHFTSLQLLISTTFCGDWAGKAWNMTSCGKLAPTCEEYVSKNPAAFKDAYWAIQSIKVYLDEKAQNATKTGTADAKSKQRKRQLQGHLLGKHGKGSKDMVAAFDDAGYRH